MSLVARHFATGRWVEVAFEGDRVASVIPADGPDEPRDSDDWLAPAFWDIQTNGRWGVSFSDPTLTVDQVAAIVRAQAGLGTARLCPTLITGPRADMLHGVRTIAFPAGDAPVLPDRFRGLPVLDESKCPDGCAACAEVCPTDAIARDGQGLRLDMGRCLFCTDCVDACPDGAIRFTQDYRLATRTREDLVVRTGPELKLAQSLLDAGRIEPARKRLQDVIDTFPDTGAAAEAAELLEKHTADSTD